MHLYLPTSYNSPRLPATEEIITLNKKHVASLTNTESIVEECVRFNNHFWKRLPSTFYSIVMICQI